MLLRVMTTAEHLERRDPLARGLGPADRTRLEKDARWAAAWEKMGLLDLDPAAPLPLSLYSQTAGRVANDPAIYVRSLLPVLHFGYTSPRRWVDAARADALARCLLGTASVPSASCHYDLVNRLTGDDPHLSDLLPEGKNTREGKEGHRERPRKGDKWAGWDGGDTLAPRRMYWDDASCDARRWTLALEMLLDLAAVRPSMGRYGIASGEPALSGDGSCLHIHSNGHGTRVEDPPDDEHTHRHAAPDADIGWDSDKEAYFLGYTFSDISWHSRDLGIDLPVFVAQRAASQHDALTVMSATAHMPDADPGLLPTCLCHDSAADAAHIYQLLRHRGVIPIIDWNKRLSDKAPDERRPVARGVKGDDGESLEYINAQGVPCAPAATRWRATATTSRRWPRSTAAPSRSAGWRSARCGESARSRPTAG